MLRERLVLYACQRNRDELLRDGRTISRFSEVWTTKHMELRFSV